MKKSMFLVIVAISAMGCHAQPVSVEKQSDGGDCPSEAESVSLPSGSVACTFKREIVIETGFQCPESVPHLFEFQNIVACDSRPELPKEDMGFLNDQDLNEEIPVVSELTPSDKLDMVWVLDNSGSMCQEQFALIDALPDFLNAFVDSEAKLRIGITTTHVNDMYPLEPLARGGHFQASPQPVTGFDRSCWYGTKADGSLDENNFEPVRRALSIAVECMQTPDAAAFQWTDDQIRCALEGGGSNCTLMSPEELFPLPSQYRVLPTIFDTENYLSNGSYDLAQMTKDLTCMSLVGTRGYGIERGLEALRLATSPTLLAGPNQGLLRDDARFGIFILTDEDDCSGTVNTTTTCGGAVCEYAKIDPAYGALDAVEGVRDEILTNLSAAKARPVDRREVLVASIHGEPGTQVLLPTTFDCSPPDVSGNNNATGDPADTTTQDTELVQPSCTSSLGSAYWGERYEAFLRSWSHGKQFPYASNSMQPMDGLVCTGDIASPLTEIAAFLASELTP